MKLFGALGFPICDGMPDFGPYECEVIAIEFGYVESI